MFYQSYTKDRRYVTVSGKGTNFRPMDIGFMRYVISGAMMIFIAFAVFLPMGALVLGSTMRIFGYFEISNPYLSKVIFFENKQKLLKVDKSTDDWPFFYMPAKDLIFQKKQCQHLKIRSMKVLL